MAIKDAMSLSEVFAKMDIDNEVAVRTALDVYQKEITARGSEAVKLARDTIEKTGRSRGPHRSWGHEVKPISERPLSYYERR